MIVSATALFCEDIREEKAGQHTIVGVLSDNLNLQIQTPAGEPGTQTGVAMIPKLGIYVRVVIGVDDSASDLTAVLLTPDGTEHMLGSFDPDTITRSQADSRAKGSPIVGFIFKALMSPFPIPGGGIMSVRIRAGKEDRVIGILNTALIKHAA